MEYKIKIAEVFSISPGSRHPDEGDYSGQEFREKILIPMFRKCLNAKQFLTIDLDGTLGYGTSFLEEVFGGLAREFTVDEVLNHIKIISNEEDYLIDDIKEYIKDAKG